jgi:hypothetical protein
MKSRFGVWAAVAALLATPLLAQSSSMPDLDY